MDNEDNIQIDEISKKALGSYKQKSFTQYVNMTHGPTSFDKQPEKVRDKAAQGMKGISTADRKLGRSPDRPKMMASEEGPANVAAGVANFDPLLAPKKKRVLKRFKDMYYVKYDPITV